MGTIANSGRGRAEFRLIPGEADHRIANNLNLLMVLLRRQAAAARKKSEPMDGAAVGAILDECAQRMQSIALLHRMLSNGAGRRRISLDEYLRNLCSTLSAAVVLEGKVELDYDGEPLAVPARLAAELGLIVTELVLNSIRHGGAAGDCHVSVGCRAGGDGSLSLSVSDDGHGLPPGFDPLRNAGMGLQVVRALSARFACVPEFESSRDGLRVSLEIPAASLRGNSAPP